MRNHSWRLGSLYFVGLALIMAGTARAQELDRWLAAVRKVEPKGVNHAEAIEAARHLNQSGPGDLLAVLQAMDGTNALAQNWLRGITETIAQRAERAGQPLPLPALEKFLADTSHHPRARRLAYELIASRDATATERLVPNWLNDPGLELRRDAVAEVLEQASELRAAGKAEEAVRAYRRAFQAARDLDQIKSAAEALKESEQPADIARHMGFLMKWRLIGPFDNTDKSGFDVAYPPEKQIDLGQTYKGKGDVDVTWIEHVTSDSYGLVDLNKALANHKGAIAYAYTEFEASEARPVELRLGCINGNKIWLNGELLTSNHVYHASMFVDQYTGRGQLKKGRNTILLKLAQNEQTEQWAQNWQFQLRVCDSIGTAVLSTDRAAEQAALLDPTRRLR